MTRLINADELKKVMLNGYLSRDRDDLLKDIARYIDNAPTVEQPQGEWILCSDRLPEQNGYYITTCQDICENRVHTVGFDGFCKKWGRGGVIAWQPLPEPYKGGEEE